MTTRIATLLAVFAALVPCFAQRPIYKDPSAPLDRRVDDLLSRMTLEEKVSQLMNDSAAIPRLGVPAYNWWNECLHGVARAGRATVFPEPIGIASTWDTKLMFRVATAISDEARAKNNEFLRRGEHEIYQGLTFWTPNINIFRDPRWGRGMETYGEDPYLTGRFAAAFVKGMEGDDPKYLKTIATAKHYTVHSGPEPLRHVFDAVVDEYDLHDTYLPQFEAAVKAGANSVMCSYNAVDGTPSCANSRLLETILRKQWGFGGYVVSDCGAVGDIYLRHKTAPTAEQGVADALKAGTDLDCGTEYEHLLAAERAGLVTDAEIDRSVRRLLTARFRLGMFDPPSMVKYARIPYSDNDSPAHRRLAIETARESIVLLKNENRTLPLSKTLKTIAVIGPNADDVGVLLGNYNGLPTAPVTPLAGIRRKVGAHTRVIYVRGSDLATNMPYFETIPASALFVANKAAGAHGLKGEYFATANFDGRLHQPREMTYPASGRLVGTVPAHPHPLFVRVDPRVAFQWWIGTPRPGMKPTDFGVRWTGYIRAPASGRYRIGAIGQNGFELYFDGKQIASLAGWLGVHESPYESAPVDLEAGKLYPVRLDFHHFVNDAAIRLVWSRPPVDETEQAVAAAGKADAVVLALGLSPRLEGEEMKVSIPGFKGGDRVDIGLPAAQQHLLEAVAATGKPVVLLLLNGSALAVDWARDHVPAIVEAWYPGQAGGDAIADVLFGDYNPAGRLPVTFYKSLDQLPPFTDYSMKGRTYRYFTGEPLYPFGYGLSYTTFSYRNLRLPAQAALGGPVKIAVDVENSGSRAGEEVVELYVKIAGTAQRAPIRSLEGFERVALSPNERKTVEFTLEPRQFARIDANGHRVLEPGEFEISVGGEQPGFHGPRNASTTSVVSGTIRLTGASQQLD
jgi:beta-glucosidase